MTAPSLFFIFISIATKLCSGDTLSISDPKELVEFAKNIGSTLYDTVILESDLDFSGLDPVPIGDSTAQKFKYFEGNGHLITNLNIESSDPEVGFVGYIIDVGVQNLVIDSSCSITSTAFTYGSLGGVIGKLVSKSQSLQIANIVNMGTVTFTGSTSNYYVINIGGIVGACEGSYDMSITNCVNRGTVKFQGSTSANNEVNVGGIVGNYVGTSASVGLSQCINYGDITVTGSSADKTYVGGIIGCDQKNFKNTNLINFGSISTNKGSVGGITGYFYLLSSTSSNNGIYWKEGTATSAYGESGSLTETDVNSFDGSTLLISGSETSLLDKLGSAFVQIKFDESGVDDVILLVDDPYPVLPTPTREGDTFIGWYMDKAFSTIFSKLLLKSGTITLYGKWSSSNPGGGGDAFVSTDESSILSLSSSSSSLTSSSSSSSSSMLSSSSLTSSSSSSSLTSSSSSSMLSSSLSSSSSSSSLASSSSSLTSSSSSSSMLSSSSSLTSSSSSFKANRSHSSSVTRQKRYITYIFNKAVYSVNPVYVGDDIVLLEVGTIAAGCTFYGWYTDENYTHKIDFSVMPSENITLYGVSYTKAISIEFSKRDLTDESEAYNHIISLMDNACSDCYIIIKKYVDGDNIVIILAFKDMTSAMNFLELIQSDPKVNKVEFVQPFSDYSTFGESGSGDGAFIALIAVFGVLLAIVVVVAVVIYPFIMRSGHESSSDPDDTRKDDGIEMDDEPNYYNDDDNDDTLGASSTMTYTATMTTTAYTNATATITPINTFTAASSSNSATISDLCKTSISGYDFMPSSSSSSSSAWNRIVPAKINYDSAGNPISEMKIDFVYSNYHFSERNGSNALESALTKAGVSAEIVSIFDNNSNRNIDSSVSNNSANNSNNNCEYDIFGPIRAYTFDDEKSENIPSNVINRALIESDENELNNIGELLFLVMFSLRKFGARQVHTVYCGSRKRMSDDSKYTKNNSVFFPGFVSATTNRDAVRELLGKGGGILFVIENACGYRIYEDEILLEPERKFRVKEVVKESKKMTVVVLYMVDSPPPRVFDNAMM